MSNVLGGHALVIGAGMSGLAAAGALARHFDQVTVLERDRLADQPSHRPGTPQSRQLHGLLSGGLEAFCQIFPGLDQDLAAVRHLARPNAALHEPNLVDRVRAEMAAASPATAGLATLAA